MGNKKIRAEENEKSYEEGKQKNIVQAENPHPQSSINCKLLHAVYVSIRFFINILFEGVRFGLRRVAVLQYRQLIKTPLYLYNRPYV